jgi:hypothetical protein
MLVSLLLQKVVGMRGVGGDKKKQYRNR